MKQILQKSALCERGFLGQSRHEEVVAESAHWHHSVDYRLLDPREGLLRRCLCTFDCSTNRKTRLNTFTKKNIILKLNSSVIPRNF